VKKIIFFIVLLVPFQLIADPYEHCRQILTEGAFDTQITYGSYSQRMVLKNYLCSQKDRSESNSNKFDFAASIVGKFSGSSGYKKDKFTSWKSNYCHMTESSDTASAFSYEYLQVASPVIVEAWKSCVADKNKGLACWASPIAKDKILFHIKVGAGQNDNIKTTSLNLFNAKANIEIADDIQENTEETIILTHKDIYDSAIIIFKGKGSQSTVGCQYVVPAKEKKPALAKFDFTKSPGLAFAYNFEFTKKVIIDEGIILVDGNSYKITKMNNTPSRFISGAITLPQYPTEFTSAQYQALYWSCQAERGCKSGDLSCVNGCREEKTREYSKLQGRKNSISQNKYNKAKTIRANLTDVEGNSYFGEVILSK